MVQYLTDLGKETIRKLYYQVELKKKELRESHENVADYNFQAIMQREIAVLDLFDILLTDSSIATNGKGISDEDVATYYEESVRNNIPLNFSIKPGYKWDDYLTKEGLQKALALYKDDLIQKQASWHDGDFDYLPKLEGIGDMNPCSVNYNYLERQQGYRMALAELNVPYSMLRDAEDEIRNHVYGRFYESNGTIRYDQIN